MQVGLAPGVPVPAAIPIVTMSVADTTRFPPASCTATTGCELNGDPATMVVGVAVNASLAGTPTVTAKAALVPTPTPEPVALSVYPAADRSIRQPV